MKIRSQLFPVPESDRRQIPPLRNQFEAMVAGKHSGLLVEPMVDRFPFQTPYMPYHPALDADFLILKALKGALFFKAESYRDEEAFIRIIRRKNYRTDIEEKYRQFKDFHLTVAEKEYQRRLEAEMWKVTELFRQRAENAEKQSRRLAEQRAVSARKTVEFAAKRAEAYDARTELYHQLFWDAVIKNLRKEPREINISSLNLQNAFRAMAYADSQSQIMRIMKLIKVNRLKAQAEQILEHSSGQSLPSELISAFHVRFHRSTFEREVRNQLSEENFREWKDLHSEFLEELGVKYRALKAERLARADENYRIYWEIFDRLNEKVPLNLSLSQTNIQEIYKLFRYRQDGQVHHAFRAIHANRNKIMATQLNEHVNTLIPEIATEMLTYFDRSRYEDEQSVLKKSDQAQKVLEWHQEANLLRFDQYRSHRVVMIHEAEEVKENFLKIRDHLHQELFLATSQNSSNMTESLRKALAGSTGRMLNIKGKISLLNGYEPVDPITSKSRKTHLSFQTGWKEFMDQPPPYVPEAPLPVRRAFDFAANPSDYYKYMNLAQVDYQFHNIWYLKQQLQDLSGNRFGGFQQVEDLSASSAHYEPDWSFDVKEINKGQESVSKGVARQSREGSFSFEPTRVMVPELKTIPKDAVLVSRNKNDSKDIELKGSEKEMSSADQGRPQKVRAEEKKDLKKADLTEVMVRHQDSFPLEFRSIYEHQLANRDLPFKVENQSSRPWLGNVYATQQGISQMRDITLNPAVAREAVGIRWKLEEKQAIPRKRKLPRS